MAIQEHLDPYPRLDPNRLKKEFTGKSVLITGGGYGIGASIAKSFTEAGVAEIILAGRTEAKLKATADGLSSFKDTKISFHKVDITSKTDVQKLFSALRTSPDVLVNNAGFLATPANFVHADLDEFWEAFTTNVYGTALVTQSFLRHREALKHATTPAVVITLNTIGSYSVRVPGLSSYAASKAALARWSELLPADVPDTTARFISVHPGAIQTAMGIKSGLDGVFPSTDPKLAGDFIAWVASEEASFLNGRFVWVNWDVDDLVKAKGEVVGKDLFRTSLNSVE
ncbi:NAD(P)-binding protein [Hyaloscypha variabilis F]|uniref:NAD(P)-binding protein n=1 Tax=Hyaloscypha variabilis (strain UAMH 11265 / GT02V1 / F) TaxID=1149755 RepID=A0A2J6RGI5_HYAVF|nr:NAD(P)-binding protein [Hyaloscypha variabilis F]